MAVKKSKKSLKQPLAAKSKVSPGPKNTQPADIGIRSSVANMSKGTDRDVTKRKRAQKALEERQHLNELLLDSLPHIAMLIRKDRTVLAANRRARDAGVKVGGYCWRDFAKSDFIPEQHKRYINDHKKIPAGGTHCYFCLADEALKSQKPARNPELNAWGKIWDVYWIPLDKQIFLHYAIDITERKLAEKVLQESEIRYKTLFESSPDGIIIAEVETRKFQYANQTMCRMLRYSEEELTNMRVDDIHPKEALERVVSEFEAQARGDKTLAEDIPCLRKDGTLIYVDVNTVKSLVDGKESNIGFFRDITERKRVEADLMKYREQLEELVKARTEELTQANKQLLRNIEERKRLEKDILDVSDRGQRQVGRELHDSVGQQLTGIAFMTKALEQKLAAKSPDEAADLTQISKLVKEAMEQARDLAKGLHPVDLDAGGLASSLEELAEATQKLFGIRCTFKCDRPVELKDTEVAVHLYRMTQEAITNAIKHGKAKNIQMALAYGKNESTLMVKNDGLDFPKASRAKGRGMGLQIMGHRAEIIGGSLDIHKAAGGGTIVTCRFPNPNR